MHDIRQWAFEQVRTHPSYQDKALDVQAEAADRLAEWASGLGWRWNDEPRLEATTSWVLR